MQTSLKTSATLRGKTTKRLFNAKNFLIDLRSRGFVFSEEIKAAEKNGVYDLGLILKEAIDYNLLPKEEVFSILDLHAKKLFKVNFIWKAFKKTFGVDLKIPFLTGYYTVKPLEANLITTKGKELAVDQLSGLTTAPVTAIAIGTGTTAANASDTALETEITTGGGGRGAASISNETTTTTNDTARYTKTFNFTSSFAVTEEGLLDNNTSGGNLLARQVFSAINVANGDSLQVTHDIVASTS